MLEVKEWQEWELDNFSLTYNQAGGEGRRGETEKKRDKGARNWKNMI